MYTNLFKKKGKKEKKKKLHVDNKGCVVNLRYIGYVHFFEG